MNPQRRPTARWQHRLQRCSAGFSLVEMLVAVVVGSALVIAITTLLMRSEAGRRALTATNDSAQNAAFASFVLDRALRSAGSGFTQAWRQAFGCRVLAARNGSQVLPRSTAFPAPFASVPQTVALAPVLVHAGAGTGGSDVLAIAAGASGLGEAPMPVLGGSVTHTQLRLPSTLGLQGKDLVLVVQDPSQCMVQQVEDGFAGGTGQALNFGGTYASSSVAGVSLSSLGANAAAFVAPLGNARGNAPVMQLLGVANNAMLVSHDLLQLDGSSSGITPIADSVLDLRARYGVDSDGDGLVDTWVNPATPPFDATTLTDGSAASQMNLANILALRVGLVLRIASPERSAVAPTSLALFSDLGPALQHRRSLSPAEQLMRHRTVEFTVPLRNVMLRPRT